MKQAHFSSKIFLSKHPDSLTMYHVCAIPPPELFLQVIHAIQWKRRVHSTFARAILKFSYISDMQSDLRTLGDTGTRTHGPRF